MKRIPRRADRPAPARRRALVHRLARIVLAAFLFAPGAPSAQERDPAGAPADMARERMEAAIAKVKPALVRIHAVSVRYHGGREVKFETVGSGAIITGEGHVITNHHVAGNAKQITCTLSGKEEVEADLVSTDPLTDIAVLKLRNVTKRTLPTAAFGDSSRMRVGDHVFAMGSPFALSQSVTMGIVSNTEVIFPVFLRPMRLTMDGEDVGSIVRWIGHDAPIYGGNSGGPLVNLAGEIVGINEIAFGIGGAIPGNLAKEVAEKLIRSGAVSRSWVGLDVQPLLRGAGQGKGVLVGGTVEGSPAAKAGFLAGDILLSVDGRDVTVRFPEEIPVFNKRIMDLPAGKAVDAEVLRGGARTTLRMVTEERESARPKTVELRLWGMTARNLSLLAAKEMKREARDGVLVTSVRPGGPCWEAKPRITEHDVIVEVGGKAVRNLEEIAEETRGLLKSRPEPVTVLVAFERKKERYLTVVRLEKEKETRDRGFEARKAWLPVAAQVLTRELAKELGIAGVTGLRITQVYPGGRALKAGLKVGDVIVALDGDKIRPSSSDESDLLQALVRRHKIGSTITLAVRRGKETFDLPLELEPSPPHPREMKRYADNRFEFTVRDIAFLDRAQEGWKEGREGVLVEAVGEGGWASLANLAVGDLIHSVDGTPVPDVDAFEGAIRAAADKKRESVLFQVGRGIHTIFVEIRPSWNSII